MDKNEIGSEFWSVPITTNTNSLFPSDTHWFLSGRIAQSAIITDILSKQKVQTVALPSWCCESMIRPFLDVHLNVCFYPVVIEQNRLIQHLRFDCDILFVMDYFGFSSSVDFSQCKSIVIRDVTHSLFSKAHGDADYTFGSLRKWIGIPTGGFAWGNFSKKPKVDVPNTEYVKLRREAMDKKADYISGNRQDKVFLDLFRSAEDFLDNAVGIYGAASDDIDSAKHLDVDFIRKKRRENVVELFKYIGDFAIFKELHDEGCPLFLPIFIKDRRERLKRYLIEKSIYCPTHWPLSPYHRLSDEEKLLYDSEISIICDQRYDKEDMRFIGETVLEGLKTI